MSSAIINKGVELPMAQFNTLRIYSGFSIFSEVTKTAQSSNSHFIVLYYVIKYGEIYPLSIFIPSMYSIS